MGTSSKSENKILRKGPIVFVVTGTQAPFDRLLRIIDNWASEQDKYSVIAQTANSEIKFKHMTCFDFLDPDVFHNYFNYANVIIGHAGMGTIITALENEKKLIVFPRMKKYNEHRNDHQSHTAKSFDVLDLINVAYNEDELRAYLNNLHMVPIKKRIDNKAEQRLLEELSVFIHQ